MEIKIDDNVCMMCGETLSFDCSLTNNVIRVNVCSRCVGAIVEKRMSQMAGYKPKIIEGVWKFLDNYEIRKECCSCANIKICTVQEMCLPEHNHYILDEDANCLVLEKKKK